MTAAKTKSRVHLHPLMWVAVGLSIAAVALFAAGFVVPPVGVIDGSVLKAGGEILGMQTLCVVAYGIVSGKTATITHGKTTATVGAPESAEN